MLNYSAGTKLVKYIKKKLKSDKITISKINLTHNTLHSGNFYLLKNNDTIIRYIYIGRVNSCRAGGCDRTINVKNNNEYEYFEYFIIYNLNKEIIDTKIFNYQASHGHEISSKGWLNQFKGYNGNQNLEVGKNIDAISGATISVYSIVADIEHNTKLLKELIK